MKSEQLYEGIGMMDDRWLKLLDEPLTGPVAVKRKEPRRFVGYELKKLLGVKYLWDHPRIPNPDGPGYTPAHNIRRNDAGYCALDLTLAINF